MGGRLGPLAVREGPVWPEGVRGSTGGRSVVVVMVGQAGRLSRLPRGRRWFYRALAMVGSSEGVWVTVDDAGCPETRDESRSGT